MKEYLERFPKTPSWVQMMLVFKNFNLTFRPPRYIPFPRTCACPWHIHTEIVPLQNVWYIRKNGWSTYLPSLWCGLIFEDKIGSITTGTTGRFLSRSMKIQKKKRRDVGYFLLNLFRCSLVGSFITSAPGAVGSCLQGHISYEATKEKYIATHRGPLTLGFEAP